MIDTRTGTVPRRGGLLLAAWVAALIPSRADADQGKVGVTLDWAATPACLDGPHVLTEIGRILGPSSPPERDVEARVHLRRKGDGTWGVVLATEDGAVTHERSFDAESCQAAGAAVALILAVAANPAVALRGGSPDPTEAAAPVPVVPSPPLPPPAPVEPSPTDQVATAETASDVGWIVGAGIAMDTGTLPRTTLGPAVLIGVVRHSWHLELGASYWSPQTATAVADSQVGARFEGWSTEVRVGHGWTVGEVEVGPLAGVGLEAVDAAGFGGLASYSPTILWAEAILGGFATWRPGGAIGLRVEGRGAAPLSRPSFYVVDNVPLDPQVYRPALLTARASASVEVLFR